LDLQLLLACAGRTRLMLASVTALARRAGGEILAVYRGDLDPACVVVSIPREELGALQNPA
jgi:hypothetical protein